MSYQVLARKWRPRDFDTLSGQEHVTRVLLNALENNRLHHAYLFTGTRGVGKTTVARILAKCLNCETGVTATPCGKCSACQEIDSGRFVDLIEVDAASRTKVEDTRELLNNVQYSPTRGRYKIYLIDEVHMLSGHSFNALLKTLEEPPEHVKFLLATTDPQKLPITVLSRCLQFHLKNLSIEQIHAHLKYILTEEKISFEDNALIQIACAAKGSMRDALSLLDQAISFGGGKVDNENIAKMLGTIDQREIQSILQALLDKNGVALLDVSVRLTEHAADYEKVLEDLLTWLHAIAMTQVIPGITTLLDESHNEAIQKFSQQFKKEDIQLYYQIALMGRRDLSLSHNPRIGFEMILLRMAAFEPAKLMTQPQPIATTKSAEKKVTPPQPRPKTNAAQNSDWTTLLSQLSLTGMTQALAANCSLKTFKDNLLELTLDPSHAALLSDQVKDRLNQSINTHFGKTMTLKITIATPEKETPAQEKQRKSDERHQAAINEIEQDPTVQALVDKLGAQINPALVKPSTD